MEKSFVKTYTFDTQKDLKLLFTGKAACGALHSFGPAVRPNFIIHVITEGKGVYQIDNQKYPLAAGQGFIIPPDRLTFYQADREEPWSYYWAAFTGDLAASYLEGLGFDQKHPVFYVEHLEKIRTILEKTFLLDQTSIYSELMLSSLLHEFLALLQQSKDHIATTNQSANLHVQHAIDYIKSNYAADITVQSLAHALSLNRSYLSAIFRKEMNLTLQQYLTEYRLTRAAELLSISNFSIEIVAEYSGYHDPLVFSKAFKRKYALTPSQYRKKILERQQRYDETGKSFIVE
ncbi:AraC family transcriptional regulator [Enterococcus sp.]|uniref:AraC family transcriptional regulator n=1 Tax=Enterococcus sp. TaxID=35783 RepID=UPI002907346B|nr:AraC family transcriptional regulator [Enterococcus sp.]MDU5336573.1 AraC family transcriptional regulator [Enterococcus sp.]